MPNTQQAPQVDSGLGKLITVGMVLLLPVLGLALLMPAVQSARKSAMKRSLESEVGGYLESASSTAREAAKPQTPAATMPLPGAIVKSYDAEISLTPKLSIGTAMPESIYVADFKATIEAHAPKDGQGKCQLELPLTTSGSTHSIPGRGSGPPWPICSARSSLNCSSPIARSFSIRRHGQHT